jgi:hypothetical protein
VPNPWPGSMVPVEFVWLAVGGHASARLREATRMPLIWLRKNASTAAIFLEPGLVQPCPPSGVPECLRLAIE